MDILLILSLTFSPLPLTKGISDIRNIRDIRNIHIISRGRRRGDRENISIKSTVINRLLIGAKVFTIMLFN